MSVILKTKLKAAKDAVGKKEYEKARDASLAVLDYDSENYHANVFLGVSYLNLSEFEQSEQAYKKAITSSPDQSLAWQGLSQLYEKTEQWDKYSETLEHLAHLFAKTNDATKCAETLQKWLEFRRKPEHGTRMQLAQALSLMLPDSPLYPVLSTLPPPDPTNPTLTSTHPTQSAIQNSLPVLEELVSLHEQEESGNIEKEFQKRRTRLGAAGPEQLRKEVAREFLGPSQLPRLYNEIINHPSTSDELRRAAESKLLDHRQRYLSVLPSTGDTEAEKAKVAAEVDEQINGMVLLKIPNELAWTLFIEGKDAESIEQYDFAILRQFVQLFPGTARTSLIKGYFGYAGIPLTDGDDVDDDEKDVHKIGDATEDYIDTIADAFASLPDSVIVHRIMTEIYVNENDLENIIKVAESGLEVARRAEQNTGKTLSRVKKAFNVALATALVDFFPPKHHIRALGIISPILAKEPDNVLCLMGRGYILEYANKWQEADEIFSKVAQLLPDDLDHGIRAKEESAWCRANSGSLEDAAATLMDVVSIVDSLDDRETDKARCWYRLGKCYWDMGSDHREQAYRHFITSLKCSSTFAPAFTALGIYYSDHLSPPDPNRASRCFQKAFELDPREVDAARRLAEGFAEEREWDLVEVVARRTIDGEGGLEGGTATARYLPINAWAWKAVGVVELNHQNYPSAIQAFQIALRTDVDDQLSWLRLGEAYSKAGRFAAAVKALDRARELDPEDWICSYFIGEVQRQTGAYEEAITAFESILVKHPSELGVLASLGQTYLDLGQAEIATAYTSRAETSFLAAIRVVLRLIDASPGYRRVAWKKVADATFHLSRFRQFSDEDAVRTALGELIPLVSDHPGTTLAGIMTLPISPDTTSDTATLALQIALAAYEYRTSLGDHDDAARGSAHYDFGAALFAYARKVAQTAAESTRQLGIHQIKEALRCEPTNEQYWNALGSATFESQPRVAQHAYIRALEINSKNSATWTSLGLFYLHHDDVELANEAFYKAQTLDPDYALAWVGQGLVATLNGHSQEARALFEHATSLAAPVPEADVEFATRLFKKLNTASPRTAPTSDVLFPAFFVLDRFCRSRPDDASAQHLFGLICERIGHVELGIEVLGRAMSLLEAAYEESEDPVIEKCFAIAHTNMARLRLSIMEYDGVLTSTGVVIGLLPEDPEDQPTRILLAQAQFLSGLAHFKLGQLPEALGFLEAGMSVAADDPTMRGHIVVLLGQTLWAIGSDEGRESAKNQLLQSIQSDPENLMAINTLAGMGILTGDESLVDAALSEILSLPLDQRLSRDPDGDVTYLLIQHHLAMFGQGDVTQALSVAQKAVLAEPSQPEMRRTLAGLNVQQGDGKSALAVLAGTSGSRENNLDNARRSLHLEAITHSIAEPNAKRAAEGRKLAQKAVMLAPWNMRNWQALAFTHNQSQQK
ncbi:TPR-like protein [Daedalea quercina L-15889]|uniref:TPR-like protein n=1 Tax=Daedalea quercina L-15889 TaxID=1314783 RepID=A0A165PKI0_9APHY|nr:TPR-like protein [Daedalea quercina L-15889]